MCLKIQKEKIDNEEETIFEEIMAKHFQRCGKKLNPRIRKPTKSLTR